MGVSREMLVRLDRPIRADLVHLQRRLARQLPEIALGEFIALCVSLGMDVARQRYAGGAAVALKPAIADERRERLKRPLRRELELVTREIYGDRPSPGSGQVIVFCASLGMDVIRETYLGRAEGNP